ncbi:hypothetical protein GCM10022223_53460 [Kineosporia mesophila]|uniref:Uncharacterized protein n=1 Tax=Kineosporia mesophila TaxID=566012 RepID=A0ABP7AC02_9ACTN|nr:hypothetical protein [Kineosporia mesophila]MCD5351272.1 hypothetical protein [Kineosporia mesophila]
MNPDPDIEAFLNYSGRMMNVNALFADWEEAFITDMAGLRIDGIQERFRRGFAKSLAGQITLRDYEKATDWEFDTPEDLHDHLKVLWTKFYGDADPAKSLI